MPLLSRLIISAALAFVIALPLPVLAEEAAPVVPTEQAVPTEDEVKLAENEPPVVPHPISDRDTAKECLSCHKKGKKGAPVTKHPERKNCTQCHVAGADISK